MPNRLEIYIEQDCPGCSTALINADLARTRFPGMEVQVINLTHGFDPKSAIIVAGSSQTPKFFQPALPSIDRSKYCDQHPLLLTNLGKTKTQLRHSPSLKQTL